VRAYSPAPIPWFKTFGYENQNFFTTILKMNIIIIPGFARQQKLNMIANIFQAIMIT
jgi:hypothetical protein